jgi:hypothetical protein
MENSNLQIKDLDFSTTELTDNERLIIPCLLVRSNGTLTERELLRQAMALEEMIVETKCKVILLRLVFEGCLDVVVAAEGEIAYRRRT